MTTKSFEESKELAHQAVKRVFKDACSDPDMYEQLAIGKTAIAAACHDFEDQETFAICHALHGLHEGSFYKVHPIHPKADEIAKGVVLGARKQLCLERMAYAAANSYAGEVEIGIQTEVLGQLLTRF